MTMPPRPNPKPQEAVPKENGSRGMNDYLMDINDYLMDIRNPNPNPNPDPASVGWSLVLMILVVFLTRFWMGKMPL